MAELEVIIGGDSQNLDKEIAKVEKELKKLESQKQTNVKLGIDTANLDKSISSTKSKLDGLKSSLNTTSVAANTFNKATANGSNTLTQFSRIAQDAPFGIIGIGNNLTATAESFANLSRSSGGAVNALKAVGSSLLGGGGVLLAISLVTSGLTYMSQQGLTVGDVFDKLSGKFDEFGNSIKKANEEAAKDASSQIATFKAYAEAAQDSSLPLEQRLIAVKKLRAIAPFYLKDLSDEKILYGDLSGVIDKVTNSLLSQSRAKAYTSLLDEVALKQVKLYTEIQEDLNKAVKDFKIPVNDINEFQNAIKGGTGALLRYLQSVNKAPITPSDFIDFSGLENLSEKYKQLGFLNASAYKLGLKIGSETKKALPLDYTPEPKKKQGNTNEPIIKFRSELQPITADQLKPFDNAINEALTFSFIENVAVQTDELLQLLVDFNDEASQLIQGSLTDTFSGLGDAIGNALSTGGNVLNAVGNSLLASLGKFLSDMGGLLIKYGTLAVLKGKLDLAIFTGGPVAIGAGLAAIAVGVALKAAGAAIGNAARGGSSANGGSGTTGRDYSSPASTVSTGGGGGFTNGSVVFEISGTSLIGVLSNTLDKNSRLGGTLGI